MQAPNVSAEIVNEAVATALVNFSHCGLEQADAGDSIEWRIYFEQDSAPDNLAELLRETLRNVEIDGAIVSGPDQVQRENWHDNWRQYFHSVELGERLVVRPPWEAGQPGEPGAKQRMEVLIEPGMAFGTGTHATTQLCMVLAEKYVSNGCSVLDIGTGSGILAITAIKLGAERVTGTDLDEEVRENFAQNLQINGIADGQIELVVGPLESAPEGPYDLIFCNMLFNEFMPLLHLLPPRLGATGALLLSGFLLAEAAEVRARIEELELAVVEELSREEWGAFAVRRRT